MRRAVRPRLRPRRAQRQAGKRNSHPKAALAAQTTLINSCLSSTKKHTSVEEAGTDGGGMEGLSEREGSPTVLPPEASLHRPLGGQTFGEGRQMRGQEEVRAQKLEIGEERWEWAREARRWE